MPEAYLAKHVCFVYPLVGLRDVLGLVELRGVLRLVELRVVRLSKRTTGCAYGISRDGVWALALSQQKTLS